MGPGTMRISERGSIFVRTDVDIKRQPDLGRKKITFLPGLKMYVLHEVVIPPIDLQATEAPHVKNTRSERVWLQAVALKGATPSIFM